MKYQSNWIISPGFGVNETTVTKKGDGYNSTDMFLVLLGGHLEVEIGLLPSFPKTHPGSRHATM